MEVTVTETLVGVQERQAEETAAVQRKGMRVMVAIDESEGSLYALRWTLDNIFRHGGAAGIPPETSTEVEPDLVTLVHVTQPFHPIYPVGPGAIYATAAATPGMVESVRKAQEENAAALLAGALQVCTEKGIKGETLILQGEAKEMICEATEQMHVDLLVVGSRGLGRIKRAFLGSVSDYCAHHAKCPILIVKPPKESHK